MTAVQTTQATKVQVGDSVIYMDTQRRTPTRLAATVSYIYEDTTPLRVNLQCLNPDGTADHHNDVPCFQSDDEVVDRINSYALMKAGNGFERFDEIMCRMEKRLHVIEEKVELIISRSDAHIASIIDNGNKTKGIEERLNEVLPTIQDRIDGQVKMAVDQKDAITQIAGRLELVEERYGNLARQFVEFTESNEDETPEPSPRITKPRKKRTVK